MVGMGERTRCRHCGHVLWAEDIIKYGYYWRLFGPAFVYIKGVCPECARVTERFMKQEQFEAEYDLPREPSPFLPSGGT